MLPWGLITVAVAVMLLVAAATNGASEPDAASARQVALQWTGVELADAPRRDGDGWEVDVRRADGSLVEIKLDAQLELRELDEERSAGGAAAHDEVTGALRARAIERTHRFRPGLGARCRARARRIDRSRRPGTGSDRRRSRARLEAPRHRRRPGGNR